MPTGWLIAFIAIYFLSGIIMCPVSKALADDKGYNGVLFAVATVLFSGIGFLCACALPDKKGRDHSDELRSLNENVIALTEAVKKLSEEKKSSPQPMNIPVRSDSDIGLYRRDVQGDAFARLNIQGENDRPAPKKTNQTANLIFKEGRLICSACGGRLGFNDKTCPSCGASIVPAKDSEGGFFKKK